MESKPDSLPTNPINDLNLQLPDDVIFYKGKVRNIYRKGEKFASVATDRISAFDYILPRAIPYKGQILNQTAAFFLNSVKDIVPIWMESSPHPNISLGKSCEPIKLEMVIRGYLSGHAWREYKSGKRLLCGEQMPDGMIENDPFPHPIITPSTKADSGHDLDIAAQEILAQELVTPAQWDVLSDYTQRLFKRGTEIALQKGLILVDTKYEFGIYDDQIYLMDEIHTPDSSRYFYRKSYHFNQLTGKKQHQLSKEFVREWLISRNFQGLDGQSMPDMDDAIVGEIADRYIELFQTITGQTFVPVEYSTIESDIQEILTTYFSD